MIHIKRKIGVHSIILKVKGNKGKPSVIQLELSSKCVRKYLNLSDFSLHINTSFVEVSLYFNNTLYIMNQSTA